MKCISAAWISYLPHGCSGLTESLLQSRKFSRRTRRSCRIVTGSHWSCPPTVSLCSDDTWLSRQATKYSEEESSWCSRCRRPRSLVVSLRGEFISVCSPGQAASSHLRTAKTGICCSADYRKAGEGFVNAPVSTCLSMFVTCSPQKEK